MNKRYVFVRFDDIEEKTKGLEDLINFFVLKKIPVNLGVIPARATKKLIVYLNSLKKKYPFLIEIDQHGFEHRRLKRGEFDISDKELKEKLEKGRALMKKSFGASFSDILTVPWHAHSNHLPSIAFQAGFKAMSVTRSQKRLTKLVYSMGRILNKSSLLGFHVNHENDLNYILPEISPSLDFISSYKDEGIIKPVNEVMREWESEQKEKYVGFLIHDKYFSGGREKIIFEVFNKLIKDKHLEFKKISQLIFANTPLTQEEMKKYYDKNTYYFSFIRDKHWEEYFGQPLRLLKKIPKDVLSKGYCLEVGSGSGNFLEILTTKKMVDPKKFYELDISLLGLKFHKYGIKVRANAEYLPFKDGSFDVVFSMDTLEHIIHYRKAIDELFRVVKPGGFILIRTQNFGSPFVSFAGNDLTIYKRIVADKDAVSRTTAEDVYKKFRKLGAKVIKYESWSSFTWKIPILRIFNFIPILRFKGGSCAGLFQKSGELESRQKVEYVCPECGYSLELLKKGYRCSRCKSAYGKVGDIADLYKE